MLIADLQFFQPFYIQAFWPNNFEKLTGKHLSGSFCKWSYKLNFIKNRLWHTFFFCKFCNNFKNTSFVKHTRTAASERS